MAVEPPGWGAPLITPAEPEPAAIPGAEETVQIARTASLLMVGTITSRVLGLGREIAKSYFFGAGPAVDAYGVATAVPTMLYDLLIGGMVSAALVPVFSSYAARDRKELWRLASALFNVAAIVLAAVVLVMRLLSPQLAFLMLGDAPAETLALAARMLRITVPAVLFLSLSGVLAGLLYALKRFTFPAFMTVTFSGSILAMMFIFQRQLGIASMAVGLLIGAILQMGLLLVGLRDVIARFSLRLYHPALRRVVRLYIPVLIPVVADVVANRLFLYRLASLSGVGGISWMTYAYYLMTFPQAFIEGTASTAILPTLSAHAAVEPDGVPGSPFRATLARGLRLSITLIIPATVGLFILATPVVALFYEHGDFLPLDTFMTAWALRFYLLGLPFAVAGKALTFALFSRQDTVTPAVIYTAMTIPFLLLAAGLLPTWGLFGLMVAESFRSFMTTLILALIARHRLGGRGESGIYRVLGQVVLATAVMGAATFGALAGVEALFPAGGKLAAFVSVAVPGLIGFGVYTRLLTAMGVEEINLLWDITRRRLQSLGVRIGRAGRAS